jgi:hypothetical protein
MIRDCDQLNTHGMARRSVIRSPALREGGRDQRLQVAAGQARGAVLGGDDLALLGDPEGTRDRARRLRPDRLVAGPAAATDRAAAAVEEPQPDAVLAGHLDQRQLGPVERPVGGEVAAVLVAVGVAEHDLLRLAAGADQRPVEGLVEHRLQRRTGGGEVVDGLEQR